MKVHFKKVFQLSDEYQENLIDANNFSTAKYLIVPCVKESIDGILHDDIYTLSPLSVFQIELREDTPKNMMSKFCINPRLLEAGLLLAGVSIESRSIYIYNCTNNNIYLKSDAIIGEVE